MSNLLKVFGIYAMSAGLCAFMNAAEAAPTARGGHAGVRTGGVPTTTARMPSMPTLTLNNIGNIPGDLPNANTLIVINSDQLGLSQLYQLKGRIGRSDKQAYASCASLNFSGASALLFISG